VLVVLLATNTEGKLVTIWNNCDREILAIPVAVDTTESEFVFRKALIPSFRVHIPDEPDEDEEDMFPTTRVDSEKWKKVQDSEEYMELHPSLTFDECLPFADPDLWLHLHY
jgi:hypothetical protein